MSALGPDRERLPRDIPLRWLGPSLVFAFSRVALAHKRWLVRLVIMLDHGQLTLESTSASVNMKLLLVMLCYETFFLYIFSETSIDVNAGQSVFA